MNIMKLTSQNGKKYHSTKYPFLEGKKMVLAASMLTLSFLAFSPAWAERVPHAKVSSGSIHFTGLSIHIGPGGFRLGLGVPYYSYGPVYGYPPRYYGRPGPRHFRKPPRYYGHRRHFAPPRRFNRGHRWKNDRGRGNFRGRIEGRGGRSHRGGGRR